MSAFDLSENISNDTIFCFCLFGEDIKGEAGGLGKRADWFGRKLRVWTLLRISNARMTNTEWF